MSVKILIGDVREQLGKLAPDSIDCVVTSPPYWGLRDYGVDGQIGMEPTLSDHLSVMVDVCQRIRRVLKPEGTFWLNYGDCYATSPNGRSAATTKELGNDDRTFRDKPFSTVGEGLKPKDLLLAPYRLAIALQEDGWWVRSHIIWAKSNPMPESVTDRPATSHETMFLLTKSARYHYDAQAVRMPPQRSSEQRWAQDVENQRGSGRANGGRKTNGAMKAVGGKQRGHSRRHDGFNDRWDKMTKAEQQAFGRNIRNYEPEIWRIATVAFSGAHFATFPPALVEPCIRAGCPAGGTVLDPFGGSGTVGMVAQALNRHAILIELNPEYAEIARQRISGTPVTAPNYERQFRASGDLFDVA